MKPYYEHAGVTIYHGDCLDVLPLLAAETVDVVVTSPPYNLGNTSGGGMPGKKRMEHYSPDAGMAQRGGMGKWSGGSLARGYAGYSDNLPHEEYVTWQHAMLRECWRTLTDRGAIYYNHKPRVLGGMLVSPFVYCPPEIPVRQVIIWARAGGINFSPSFYCPTHEWIVVLARSAFRLKSKGASGVGDVWYIPQEADPSHPAPFPLALPARVIETTAPRLVLDPFSGRGTTLRAAKDAGVRAVGIEINEAYCELAVNSLSQETLFGCNAAA